MPRMVTLLVTIDDRTAIAALKRLGTESERTAAKTERAFHRSQRALGATANMMSSVGRGMTLLGAGMAGLGYVSVKAAVNFQTAMTRIQTQAKVPAGDVEKLSKAVLALGGSGKSQYGPTQLALALYHVESVAAGGAVKIKGTAQAMYILKAAAQGAAVGGSNLEDTTTALMGAMTALHAPASQARMIMGLLNTTVGIGNMRMQDLVNALGKGALPAFRNAGLGAKDLFAALALTSDQGTKAASASAQLATALHYLADPTSKATKAFGQFNADKISQDMAGPGGLLKALTDVNDLVKGMSKWQANKLIFTLMPSGRGRVLQQILNNLDQYSGKLGKFNNVLNDFNAGVDTQSKTMSGKLHASWAVIQTDLVKFGNTLLPIVAHWLPKFTSAISDVLRWLARLPAPLKNFLVPLTAAFLIGGPLLIGLAAVVRAFRELRALMFALRGGSAAAAAAVAATAAAGGGGAAGGKAAKTAAAADAAAAAAAGGGAAAAASRASKARAAVSKAAGFLRTTLRFVGNAAIAAEVYNAITQALGATLDRNAPRITSASGQQYYNPRVAPFAHAQGGVVKGYQFGGPVGTDTVPAWLTPGEGVLTRAAMSGIGARGLSALNSGGGMGGITISPAPVYLVLDGRIIARSVLKQVLNKAARGPSSLTGGSLVTGVSVPVNRGFG